MTPISEITIVSIEQYIADIEKRIKTWGLHHTDIWYRGVASRTYKLQPGVIWRGIDHPLNLIDDFLLHYEHYYEKAIDDPWELYALMQHYGLPTKLLDWTQSPLTALFFALEEKNKNSKNERIVWMMSPHQLNESLVKEEMVYHAKTDWDKINKYLPRTITKRKSAKSFAPNGPLAITVPLTNKRIKSQHGCFTVHGKDSESVEEYFEKLNKPMMTKFVIEEKTRKKLRNSLYCLSYKEDDVYQDLNSLSRRIIREWGYEK